MASAASSSRLRLGRAGPRARRPRARPCARAARAARRRSPATARGALPEPIRSRSVPSLCPPAGAAATRAARTAMRSGERGAWRGRRGRRRPPTLAAPTRRDPASSRAELACGRVPTVWTIGYERLLPPELVAELEAAGVERVIDVRFRPQSRRPGMSKTRLGQLLGDHGIAYEHRRELGTPADLRFLFHAGPHRRGRGGVPRARRGARAARARRPRAPSSTHAPPTALLCLEADPAGCHRRVITDALRERRTDLRSSISRPDRTVARTLTGSATWRRRLRIRRVPPYLRRGHTIRFPQSLASRRADEARALASLGAARAARRDARGGRLLRRRRCAPSTPTRRSR